MNKSLLLVICDFLLISLLGLANFDDPAETQEDPPIALGDTEGGDARDDLIMLLEESLQEQASQEEKLKSSLEERDRLLSEKEATIEKTQSELTELASDLENTSEQLAQTAAEKAAAEEAKAKLAQERAFLEEEKNKLQQVTTALSEQKNTLEKELSEVQLSAEQAAQKAVELEQAVMREKQEKAMTLEQAQFLREELKREKEALARASEALVIKEQEQQVLSQEREAAKRQLEVVAAQNEILEEQVKTQLIQQERLQVRTEQLSENVEVLAQQSSTLQDTVNQDIEERRTLSANQLYDQYQRNQIELVFVLREKGALGLGERVNTYEMAAPVIEQAGAYYAMIHKSSLFGSQIPLEMRGLVQVDQNKYPITQMITSTKDPAVLWIPVGKNFIESNRIDAFSLEQNPLRYEEGFIVSDQSGYYGALSLRLHPEKQSFIRVDNRIVTRLFGEFSASEGDYIFSNKGSFIGMMTNKSDGLLVSQLSLKKRFLIGNRYDPATVRAALND